MAKEFVNGVIQDVVPVHHDPRAQVELAKPPVLEEEHIELNADKAAADAKFNEQLHEVMVEDKEALDALAPHDGPNNDHEDDGA